MKSCLSRRSWVVLVVLIVVYLITHLATISDYGVMWDCWEFYAGDRNLMFYKRCDPAYLNYKRRLPMDYVPGEGDLQEISWQGKSNPALLRPHHIWPVGPTSASLTKRLFSSPRGAIDPVEGYHLAPILWFLGTLIVVFGLVHCSCGLPAAAFSFLALATVPRLIAHSHFNVKDMPLLFFYALTVYAFYLATTRSSKSMMLLSAMAWGAAVASKANALFLPVILIPWFIGMQVRAKAKGNRTERSFVLVTLLYPIVGFAVIAVLWPYLLLDFPTNLQAHIDYLMEKGAGGPGLWQWRPLRYLIVTTPIPMLILAGVGVYHGLAKNRLKPLSFLLLLSLGVTTLRVCMPSANAYDGMRMWVEVWIPVAAYAGLGAAWLAECLGKRVSHGALRNTLVPAALAATLIPAISWNVRNHPYQLAHFNSLVGGLPGARKRNMADATDYWGSSYREGTKWLNRNASPNSLILVGLAPQSFYYTATTWLRADLEYAACDIRTPEQITAMVQEAESEVYVIYVTRNSMYSAFVEEIDRRCNPTFEGRVEGEPILKIQRIR